jgi:hypothetical protein
MPAALQKQWKGLSAGVAATMVTMSMMAQYHPMLEEFEDTIEEVVDSISDTIL